MQISHTNDGKMSPSTIVIYCGLLLTVTAFSVDITLPAFGLMVEDLRTPYSAVQLVVPMFIIATGVGQIFAGPLSDRFGRRPVVLVGISIYVLGAAICAISTSIEVLLAGRIIQGLGAAAGPVVGRAILRDLFGGKMLARNMALAAMIFAFGPIVAPLMGVSIMSIGEWRSIFFVIGMFGTLLVLVGWLALPESNRQLNPDATKLPVLTTNARTALSDPQSRFYLIMAGPIMAMMMTILISIPRVFKESFGVDGALFAILFALHGLGIIIGQIANRKMIEAYGTAQAMKTGAAVLFGCCCLMFSIDLSGHMNALALTASMILFATGYLVVMSNATALALDPNGEIAGFVSSLFGLSGQLVGPLIGIIAAQWIGGDVSTFILVLWMLSGAVLFILTLGDPSRKVKETA